jgi:hypothetical protein
MVDIDILENRANEAYWRRMKAFRLVNNPESEKYFIHVE